MYNLISSIFLLQKLRQVLKLGKAELEEIQRSKLSALINHAYENVPYYRKLFDSVKLKPQHIKRVEDLKKIPMTDKLTLRALDREEIISKDVEITECVKVFTSGSTGMPTNIYFTKNDYELIDLVYMRSFLENGLRFRHKRAFILDPHSFDSKKPWYQKLGIARSLNISCFEDPEEQLRMLSDNRPDFIHGYPSSLGFLSNLILESKKNRVQPSIISTAAELLDRKNREVISAAFGVKPYDRYAARECGLVAWECSEHKGYHINIDALVVEFVKDGKDVNPGERGEVVVTNLFSYAMPFIRYKVGDIGIPSEEICPCGLQLPLMEIIEGRDEDFIVLKGGEIVSPMMVTGTLDHIPGIKQFRVVQKNPDSVVAIIAKGERFLPDTPGQVENALRNILGENILIKCQTVEDIPREKSGKVRAVISKVSNSRGEDVERKTI